MRTLGQLHGSIQSNNNDNRSMINRLNEIIHIPYHLEPFSKISLHCLQYSRVFICSSDQINFELSRVIHITDKTFTSKCTPMQLNVKSKILYVRTHLDRTSTLNGKR